MPRRQPAVEAMGRLVVSADFERVLGSRSRANTLHFAVHHLPTPEVAPAADAHQPAARKLSTISGRIGDLPVDDLPDEPSRRLGVESRNGTRAAP